MSTDAGKQYWLLLCKDYFSAAEEPIKSGHHILLLQLLEFFDSLTPSSGLVESDWNISIIPDAVRDLADLCSISVIALIDSNGALWYDLNTIRNQARSEVHAEV